MKKLVFISMLISLCSCNRSMTTPLETQPTHRQEAESVAPYVMPKINFHKSITIDSDIATLYENMFLSNDENENEDIIGNKAFYIMVDQQSYPTYDEVSLNFYRKTKVSNILFTDIKNAPSSLSDFKKEHLKTMRLEDVKDFNKEGLVWGKHNLDNPELDMLNKAYVIRTQEVKNHNGEEVKAESMYLIWFDCVGGFREISKLAYSCGSYNLKLHYKLLDYKVAPLKM